MNDVKINFNESEVNSDNLSGVLISEDAAESLVRCFLLPYFTLLYLASLP